MAVKYDLAVKYTGCYIHSTRLLHTHTHHTAHPKGAGSLKQLKLLIRGRHHENDNVEVERTMVLHGSSDTHRTCYRSWSKEVSSVPLHTHR